MSFDELARACWAFFMIVDFNVDKLAFSFIIFPLKR